MVVKAEDMKKKGEAEKRERFEKSVANLETAIDREIAIISSQSRTLSKTYSYGLPGNEDKKLLERVMQDYRAAGWNVEYKPEGDQVYDHYKEKFKFRREVLVLTVSEGNDPKNEKSSVICASTIEKRIQAHEAEKFEGEVKRYEEEIDKKLNRDCEYPEICYDAGIRDAKMKSRIKTIYEEAGWQVQYRVREVPWQDGHVDRIPCIVFKRQE